MNGVVRINLECNHQIYGRLDDTSTECYFFRSDELYEQLVVVCEAVVVPIFTDLLQITPPVEPPPTPRAAREHSGIICNCLDCLCQFDPDQIRDEYACAIMKQRVEVCPNRSVSTRLGNCIRDETRIQIDSVYGAHSVGYSGCSEIFLAIVRSRSLFSNFTISTSGFSVMAGL